MMQVEIVKEKEMPLLERKRITANVSFDGSTPSRSELRKDLAKKQKVDGKLIAIRHVFQKFGSSNAKLIAHVYKDFDALCALEKDGKRIQDDMKKAEEAKKAEEEAKKAEAEKAAEAPKEEAKPEEAAAEEPSEETKAEEKTEAPKEESKGEE